MVKEKVKAGKVDCQAYAQTCQKAGIRAYPTVKFYPYEGTRVRIGFPLCAFPFTGQAQKVCFSSELCLYPVSFPLSFFILLHVTETSFFLCIHQVILKDFLSQSSYDLHCVKIFILMNRETTKETFQNTNNGFLWVTEFKVMILCKILYFPLS